MKIGFDAKRLFHNTTGLGNYSRDLIRILSHYFPENEYYLYNPKKANKDLFSLNQSNSIEIRPTTFFWKKFKSVWRSLGISSEIKRNTLQIYHGLSGEIPFSIPKSTKKVVTIHDLIFMRYPKLYSFWDRKIHFYKFKFAAQKSDRIVAISEQTKLDIIHYLDIDPDKIDVIYQGCAAVYKELISASELEKVRKKFNLPSKFILNVGTIEPRKNALHIVKSIQNTDIPLVLIGRKTEYYNEIEQFISNQNSNQVIHLSNVSQHELACIYQLAAIFVYPSLFEGFGIPIIEALYSKTPVITNKFGVFPEAGGAHSIYIDPSSVSEMQNALLELWNNDEKRRLIADQGYEFVQKFNDEAIAENWATFYKNISNT